MLLAATSGIAEIWLVAFGPKLTTRSSSWFGGTLGNVAQIVGSCEAPAPVYSGISIVRRLMKCKQSHYSSVAVSRQQF